LYELSRKGAALNQTFNNHTDNLFNLFKKKGLKLPEANSERMTLDDYYSIIWEIWQDDLEQRYVSSGITWSSFNPEEKQNVT
jgi:hypothetical protein